MMTNVNLAKTPVMRMQGASTQRAHTNATVMRATLAMASVVKVSIYTEGSYKCGCSGGFRCKGKQKECTKFWLSRCLT